VPITNPVAPENYGKNGYPKQSFLDDSLKQQSIGKINAQIKSDYSINWPLFFAFKRGYNKLQSWINTVPSANTANKMQAQAVNYAWASAVIGQFNSQIKGEDVGNCYKDSGKIAKVNCRASDIKLGRKSYIDDSKNNPNLDKDNKFSYDQLVIPNLQSQMVLYFQQNHNQQNHKATIFISYIGLNDVGNFFKDYHNIINIILKSKEKIVLPAVKGYVKNYIDSLNMLSKDIITDDHIYVFSLPHISNFYEVYNKIYNLPYPPFFGPLVYGLTHKNITEILDYAIDQFNRVRPLFDVMLSDRRHTT